MNDTIINTADWFRNIMNELDRFVKVADEKRRAMNNKTLHETLGPFIKMAYMRCCYVVVDLEHSNFDEGKVYYSVPEKIIDDGVMIPGNELIPIVKDELKKMIAELCVCAHLDSYATVEEISEDVSRLYHFYAKTTPETKEMPTDTDATAEHIGNSIKDFLNEYIHFAKSQMVDYSEV